MTPSAALPHRLLRSAIRELWCAHYCAESATDSRAFDTYGLRIKVIKERADDIADDCSGTLAEEHAGVFDNHNVDRRDWSTSKLVMNDDTLALACASSPATSTELAICNED